MIISFYKPLVGLKQKILRELKKNNFQRNVKLGCHKVETLIVRIYFKKQISDSAGSYIIKSFRPVHDRELQHHDGTRLLRADRYDELKSRQNLSDRELNEEHGIFRIHPHFLIVATAAPLPPKSSSSSSSGTTKDGRGQWLTPEMLSLFFYHRLPQMSLEEEIEVIKSMVWKIYTSIVLK